MLKRVVASVMVLAGLLGVGFANNAHIGQATSGSFYAGTVDLAVSPAHGLFGSEPMAPGDMFTRPLQVINQGGGELRYSISSLIAANDGDFDEQLRLTIKTKDMAGPGSACSDFDGVQLYRGASTGAAGALVGSNAVGSQSGDRTLKPGGQENLCFRIELPLEAGNSSLAGKSAVAFQVEAEQTAGRR